MKKCVIVYNPNSGKKIKKDFLAAFIDILLEREYVPEIIFQNTKDILQKL